MDLNNPYQVLTTHEKRKHTRYPFHWPVIITLESARAAPTHRGSTHEISAGGCSVLTDDNILPGSAVTIQLALPLEQVGAARDIIAIEARVVHTVLSSGHQKFRCGIQFLQFHGDGRDRLARAIEARAASSVGRSAD